MGNVIDKLNKKMERRAGSVKIEAPAVDPFGEYEKAKEMKKEIEISFDVATDEGDLVFLDENGIKVFLSEEIFSMTTDYYKPRIKSKFIGIKLSVLITKIDKDNKIVYVKSARGHSHDRAELISEINYELSQGNMPKVLGKVTYVSPDRAFINICGMNVSGIVSKTNWSKGYIRFLNEQCKKEMIYPFTVIGESKRTRDNSNESIYRLSHKDFTEDPWTKLDTTLIQQNGVLFVKCIDKPSEKSYWWGTSRLVDGIEMIGNYTGNIRIIKGITYKCKIRKFSVEERMLQVTPFEVAEQDLEKYRFSESQLK